VANQTVNVSNMSKGQRRAFRALIDQVGNVVVEKTDQGMYTLTYQDKDHGDQQISHNASDLYGLIAKAKQERDFRVIESSPEITEIVVPEFADAPEVVEESEVVEDAEKLAEVAEAEAAVEADVEAPSNVIDIMNALSASVKAPIRRAVLTEEDVMPKTLTGVILDNTGKKQPRIVKVSAPKRDNRLARAFRAIIENPTMTVAEQASVADVTVAMLGYYEIQLRSVFKIIYEKYGDDVIPMLPALNK
jgi:hypothetical protein